jgi:hypothetical protein
VETLEANEAETSLDVDFGACLRAARLVNGTPYDLFIASQRDIVLRSANADEMELRLLLMALTSATEMYFRCVLAGAVSACPICVESTLDSAQVSLAASQYYTRDHMPLALMEGASFSDSTAIRKKTKELTLIEIPVDSSVHSIAAALESFDRVCSLRHAAIHAWGVLSAKNLRELDVKAADLREVCLDQQVFLSVAEVCVNVVRAYNRFMFERLLQRLFKKKRLSGAWEEDKEIFAAVVSLYVSAASLQRFASLEDAYACAKVNHLGDTAGT